MRLHSYVPVLCLRTKGRDGTDWHLEHGGYYRHHLLSHELRNLPTESMTNRLIARNSLHGIDWLAFIVQSVLCDVKTDYALFTLMRKLISSWHVILV